MDTDKTCEEVLTASGWGWMFGSGRETSAVVASIAQRCDLAPVYPDVVDRAVQLIEETRAQTPSNSLHYHSFWPRGMYDLMVNTLDLPHSESLNIDDWAKVLFVQVTALLQAVMVYEGVSPSAVRNVPEGTSPDSENPAYANSAEGQQR